MAIDERSALETQTFSTAEILRDQAQRWASSELTQSREIPDLGLDTGSIGHASRRLLNRNGSFNVTRMGTSFIGSKSLYHYCLNTSWPTFLTLIFASYLLINLFFGTLFFLAGPNALTGMKGQVPHARFTEAFFFSVQTFATIGYGQLAPSSLFAHAIVTAEALCGLLGFALATGLFFARFSRPTARITFSNSAVISNHHGKLSFQFRVVNQRKNQLIDLRARVAMSRFEQDSHGRRRRYYDLGLERAHTMFFPLHWTVVHAIDESSPLFGASVKDLRQSDVEFLVLISGTDDTFSQVVHAWTSYKAQEIVWNGIFENILSEHTDGSVVVDVGRIHNVVKPSI